VRDPAVRMLWHRGFLFAVMLAAACVLVPTACRRADTPAEKERVIIVGVDGLHTPLMHELVGAGKLPNFKSIIEQGAAGTMSTWETKLPPLSTRIWTSVATGVLPKEHGIFSFFTTDSDGSRRMLTGAHRKSAAMWQIASRAGMRVGVVNWWFTYPVEELDGFIISDRYIESWARRSAKFWNAEHEWSPDSVVYPPELDTALRSIEEVPSALGPDPESAEKKDGYIFDLSYKALETQPAVDLLLIYTRGMDELSHMQWHTHEPLPGEKPTRDLVVDYMIRFDGILGRLLERLTPSDTLMVLSDHGFERSTKSVSVAGPPTTGEHQTKESAYGLFLMMGPRIKKGESVGVVSVLDILPTTLELLDIPAAENMPGKVFRKAYIDPEFETLPRVATYERGAVGVEASERSKEEEERIDHLRALGYLD